MAAILHKLDQRRLIDSDGIADGASIFFYLTGTTTLASIFSDADLSVPMANPVIVGAGALVPNIYLDSNITYRQLITYLDGTSVNTDPYINDNGADSVTFVPNLNNPASRSVQDKLRETCSLTDIQGVAADGTDQTTDIINGIANSGYTFFIAPPGLVFDRGAVLDSPLVPIGTVIEDRSYVNDWQQAGSTVAQNRGLLTKGTGPLDTHEHVSDVHHVINISKNYGSAGTASGAERKASWLWAGGDLKRTGEGFRGIAMQQFTGDTVSNKWSLNLRRLAPFDAISRRKGWRPGETGIVVGDYRSVGERIYVAASEGTTGTVRLTHTAGTVTDGGVQWTYYNSENSFQTWIDEAIPYAGVYRSNGEYLYKTNAAVTLGMAAPVHTSGTVGSWDYVCATDTSLAFHREDGRVLWGSGALDVTFRHKVDSLDTNGNYIGEFAALGLSKDVLIKLIPTDGVGVGAETAVPFLRANALNGLQIVKSNGVDVLAAFTDNSGTRLHDLRNETMYRVDQAAVNNQTIDGTNKRVVYVTSAAAANIDAISNSTDGQQLRLIFLDGNSTVRHMIGNIHLKGAVNQLFTQYSTLDLHKVPSGITDRWVEVSRNLM